MRQLIDDTLVHTFLKAFGSKADQDARVYFTGGVGAVLGGWRESTVDIDLLMVPELDSLFRAIPELKESMQINVELASPPDFIPELPGWEDRSVFIERVGRVSFYHYDWYSQALSKIERGHEKDLLDVHAMVDKGLVVPAKALELFSRIEPELFRYPAIDPPSFQRKVNDAFLVEG